MLVKKWYNVRNTVVAINKSVSKEPKQLAGAISLLNSIRGGEAVDVSKSQNECTIKI